MPTKAQTCHKTSLSWCPIVGDLVCFLFKLLKGCCMVVFSINRLFPVEVFRVTEYTITWPFRGSCRTFYPRMIWEFSLSANDSILSTSPHQHTNLFLGSRKLVPGLRERNILDEIMRLRTFHFRSSNWRSFVNGMAWSNIKALVLLKVKISQS